ncbi:helix-turn-helix domain-containing protein [Methylosarcina fibrata]|uniref:helix-turn-helix domain-containing protein n=1 Tax=Methylosarcina fibrata TaxID=105972 RepID=UPI00036CE5BB|nr:helix-turn-helix domain-containing protein [Methylosarcina fibrata]
MLQTNTDLLNTKQAAEYLGVTVSTLEVWRCTKRYPIPFIKVGHLVKYRKTALDAFLESRTVDAADGQ